MTDAPAPTTVGGFAVTPVQQHLQRMSALIWGSAGSGKTSLAVTAPGKKLIINFDPDGTAALAGRDDLLLLDLSDKPNSVVEQFKTDNILGGDLEKLLRSDPSIETVIFDSLTSFGERGLYHGVTVAQKTAKGRTATIEDPGFGGHGNKNTWMNLAVTNMLRLTAKLNRHVIFIAHEDVPDRNDDGSSGDISIMLGSTLREQVPLKISEVWHLSDTGKERRIAIRPCRRRKPMRTRMFETTGDPEFNWKYNAATGEGHTIAAWYEQWKKNKFVKIPLPK